MTAGGGATDGYEWGQTLWTRPVVPLLWGFSGLSDVADGLCQAHVQFPLFQLALKICILLPTATVSPRSPRGV